MAHSKTSINIHYIFSPKNRIGFGSPEKRKTLQHYINGICHNLDCVVLASYVMRDHVHLLVRIPAKMPVAELAQKVKGNCSRCLNQLPDQPGRFVWQEGYGAFSCSFSNLGTVISYIQNQEEHHRVKSFDEEFGELLKKHEIPADSGKNDGED